MLRKYGADYHGHYLDNFVVLVWNGGPDFCQFDTNEIDGNIKVGEHYYPEIFKSVGGQATKITREQPREIEFTVKLYYPKTVEKINKIIAYTRGRYRLDAYVVNYADMPAGTTVLFPSVLHLRSVIEYPASISTHYVGAAKGIERGVKNKFTLYEARDEKWPVADPSPIPTTTRGGTGRNIILWYPGLGGGFRTGPVGDSFPVQVMDTGISLYLGNLPGVTTETGLSESVQIYNGSGVSEIELQNGWIYITDEMAEVGTVILTDGTEVRLNELFAAGGGTRTAGGGAILYEPLIAVQ